VRTTRDRQREFAIFTGTATRSRAVDGFLVELLALADAARRAVAAHVTAVVPYFGDSRADKRHGRREPTVDLHVPQTEGVGGGGDRPGLPIARALERFLTDGSIGGLY
jgi:phosphoribosylpyrophosphate synthetase